MIMEIIIAVGFTAWAMFMLTMLFLAIGESQFIKNLRLPKRKPKPKFDKITQIEVINYCLAHKQYMWSATILSMIFQCDFRDTHVHAENWISKRS